MALQLGLIARADNRGLGQQTWAVYRNLKPTKTLVVDCPSDQPLEMRLDRFPDATVVSGWPSAADFDYWLRGLDVVYTAETGYGTSLWTEAQRLGVKTVLHANYEFLNPYDQPSLWAAPSLWHIDQFPPGAVHLPVPIETDRFPSCRASSGTARSFLHIVGRPAVQDRNGTLDLLAALDFVQSEVSVTIKCQQPGYVPPYKPRNNVTLTVDSGDVENYWDNYTGFDALIMPRRFGGLCLPVNEALGAGMPVIMPDISPNNTWLPQEWLIPAGWKTSFRAKQQVDVYGVNPKDLATKIDQMAQPDFYSKAAIKARELADQHSWQALKPLYEKVLANA